MSSVRLVSVSTPTIDINGKVPSAEELIVYCARVSSPKNQENIETAPKLLRYCVKHGHWSIFEMVNMCIEINTSRAISAQILRHRSFSFQEFSQRYAAVNSTETYDARRQDLKNRQNSIDDFDDEIKNWFTSAQEEVANLCMERYEQALEKGIAKETARFLLPMSSSTKLYMNGTLRSWITYIMVRAEKGTQQEHRDIALAALEILKEHFPNVYDALKEVKPEIFV